MFSLMEVANRKLSWNTIDTARLSETASASRTSTPPMRTEPPWGSARRTNSWARELFPTPVLPTMATDSCGCTSKDTPVSTESPL
jgi:hypothetical protein